MCVWVNVCVCLDMHIDLDLDPYIVLCARGIRHRRHRNFPPRRTGGSLIALLIPVGMCAFVDVDIYIVIVHGNLAPRRPGN